MFSSFGEFFSAVKEARFGFREVWQWITDLYYSITVNSDIADVWDAIMRVLDPIYSIVPYVLIALCIAVAFFGKKMMPVIKFSAFFVLGFVLGVYYITPLLNDIIAIPPWVSGLVIAIVAAVLYRFLYFATYAVAVGYSVYILCYSGFYLAPEVEYTSGKALVSLVIALAAVVLAFILMKYVEIVGTSLLGGYLVAVVLRGLIYDYRELGFLESTPWLGALVITLVIAIPGFIVQLKTRRRY